MDEDSTTIASLSKAHPGYENLIGQLHTLLYSGGTPFIYINDPITELRMTSSAVSSVLFHLSSSTPKVYSAQINAVACFSPRIFFDSTLNALAEWDVQWQKGAENWTGEGGRRWNDNLDSFLHGLRTFSASKKDKDGVGPQMVLVVQRAEKLREGLIDLLVPLTRLAELVRADLICCSNRTLILYSPKRILQLSLSLRSDGRTYALR